MMRLRRTKKTFRECLVCGTLNNSAHMGIDVCRACSVFYRRALESKKPYACRSGTGRCAAGKSLNCRRCRLHHIEMVLKVSVTDRVEQVTEGREMFHAPIPAMVTADDSPMSRQLFHMEADTSSSNSAEFHGRLHGTCDACSMPLLTRVKMAYDKLCFARLIGEQFDRKEAPGPMRICSDDYPIYPATFATLNKANRILTTCILGFGANAFPEFAQFSDDEKWSIATKYFYSFRILDQSYRARTRFANEPHKKFAGYTLYLSEDIIDNFFDDYDKQGGNLEEAKRFLKNDCRMRARRSSFSLDKRHPDEYEFFALLVLLFWATNGIEIRDEINQIGDNYKEQISRELHIYYRDVLHLDDYAMRLGELYSSLPTLETHNKIKESFEVFRLLDIFSDDTFTYKLAK